MRLIAQRIETPDPATVTEVVRYMLAMQGQDLPGAKWSIGLRTPGATLVDVDAALASAEVIRSWPMRGTLHLVAAEDIGWMLDLTAARTLQSLRSRHRELGIDEAAIAHARDVSTQLLDGGSRATRAEVFQAFETAGVETTGQRGVHLLGALHQLRHLCLGPMRGTDQEVVLMDEWVRQPRSFTDRDEALGEYVRRYFLSHGPATIRDFTWWTKLPVKDAKTGLAVAKDHLAELVVDGTSYFLSPGLPDTASENVHALPGFDEFLLGYQDRSAGLDAQYAQLIVPGNNGMFQSTIVVHGRVVGTWRRKRTSAGLTVTPVPFERISGRNMARFRTAAAGYGKFLGVPVAVGEA